MVFPLYHYALHPHHGSYLLHPLWAWTGKEKSEESPRFFKILDESSSTTLLRSASVRALGSSQEIFDPMSPVLSVKPKLKYTKTVMQHISPLYRPGDSLLFPTHSNSLLPWTLELVGLFYFSFLSQTRDSFLSSFKSLFKYNLFHKDFPDLYLNSSLA